MMLSERNMPYSYAEPWPIPNKIAPRACKVCGEQYQPKSRNQLYCDDCRKVKKRERDREYSRERRKAAAAAKG